MCCDAGRFTVICKSLSQKLGLFSVSLYNSDKKIIDTKKTDENGRTDFELPYSGLYTVHVNSLELCPRAMVSEMYLNNREKNMKYFLFDCYRPAEYYTKATIKLTDKNYEGLPIIKGVTKLWQEHPIR